MAVWVRALRPACGDYSAWHAHSGAPALLRALCEQPRTGALAVELLAGRREPPTTTDAVLREADLVEKAVVRREWLQRRDARMTVDGLPVHTTRPAPERRHRQLHEHLRVALGQRVHGDPRFERLARGAPPWTAGASQAACTSQGNPWPAANAGSEYSVLLAKSRERASASGA